MYHVDTSVTFPFIWRYLFSFKSRNEIHLEQQSIVKAPLTNLGGNSQRGRMGALDFRGQLEQAVDKKLNVVELCQHLSFKSQLITMKIFTSSKNDLLSPAVYWCLLPVFVICCLWSHVQCLSEVSFLFFPIKSSCTLWTKGRSPIYEKTTI